MICIKRLWQRRNRQVRGPNCDTISGCVHDIALDLPHSDPRTDDRHGPSAGAPSHILHAETLLQGERLTHMEIWHSVVHSDAPPCTYSEGVIVILVTIIRLISVHGSPVGFMSVPLVVLVGQLTWRLAMWQPISCLAGDQMVDHGWATGCFETPSCRNIDNHET